MAVSCLTAARHLSRCGRRSIHTAAAAKAHPHQQQSLAALAAGAREQQRRDGSGTRAWLLMSAYAVAAGAGMVLLRPAIPQLEGEEAPPLLYSDGMPARAASDHSRANAAGLLPKRKYTYVIIGAGTTASAAIESILNLEPDADILLLADETTVRESYHQQDIADTQEDAPPVQIGRDLLHSYNEWRRHISGRLPDVTGQGVGRYGPVTVAHRSNLKIDSDKRRILLDDGAYSVYYDKCLIATPGKPRRLYVLDPERTRQQLSEMINTLSDLEDFQALELLPEQEAIKHVTVIGGGFLGSEVALALARRSGLKVSQVYAEMAPMQRLLPSYLAAYLQKRLEQEGVEPIRERLVTDLRFNVDKGCVELVLQGWEKQALQTDYIVLASTHIEPCVGVAAESGLEVDKDTGGIVVNGQFEAVAGVYAAGGTASYYDAALGRRRIDRYDHSVNSGLLAGYNMAASLASARTQHGPKPMLRSTLSGVEVVMEGLGEIDARLRTVGLWLDKNKGARHLPGEPVYRRGLVYYLRGDKVVGILLWNTTDLLERAREVLRAQPKITSIAQLKQQIPLAPDDWLRLETTPGKVQFGSNEVLTPPF